MAALSRVFGKTSLQVMSCRSFANLLWRNNRVAVRQFAQDAAPAGKNGLDKYAQKPECVTIDCDPEVPRIDDVTGQMESRKLKIDQLSAYLPCPPAPAVVRVSCADMPSLPVQIKKKRRPFVNAAACKKPKPSASANECNKIDKAGCSKTRFPNCPPARNPPVCEKKRIRDKCEKVPAPFPAYSECFTPLKSMRKDECECHLSRNVCI